MPILKINNQHKKYFKYIVKKYKKNTNIPSKNNWIKKTNKILWQHMIEQIMVIGGSSGVKRFNERDDLKKILEYDKLLKINNDKELMHKINYVLIKCGARYASKNIQKCNKTKALLHNFKILRQQKNGMKGILKRLSEFHSDLRRVKYLMKIFKFFQSKSARDYLMSQGLCRNTIAIDIRIRNILKKKAGLIIPPQVITNPKIYDQVEKEIIQQICHPLKIEGIVFDRILYQNYHDILADKNFKEI